MSFRAIGGIQDALGGRRVAAAIVLSATILTVLLVPASLLSASLVEAARGLARGLEQGTLEIPPPPDWVGRLPFVGANLHDFWREASTDLETALVPIPLR